MKKGIKPYWILFIAGCIVLTGLSIFEQKQINNQSKQLQLAYQKTQGVIRAKELFFVQFIQSELLLDTLNLQRNWNSIHKKLSAENINLFIVKNDTLLFWGNNDFDFTSIHDKGITPNHAIIKASNGWYLLYQQKRGNFRYYFLYLVKNQFSYRNQYLQNKFNTELDFLEEAVLVNTRLNEQFQDIFSISGQYLFSIQIFTTSKSISTWLFITMMILLLYCILLAHVIMRYYIRNYPIITTVVFFAVMVWIRWINTFYNIPYFIYNIKLFSAGVYASSAWFPSLGDLLIDSAIILWYFILLENRKNHSRVKKLNSSLFELSLYGILSLFSSNTVFSAIKSLTIDSQISFDITQIYSINSFTYFAIAVCIIQLLVVYFISRNFTRAIRQFDGHYFWVWGISITLALLYLLIANKLLNHDILRYWSVMLLAFVFIVFKLLSPRLNRFQQYFVVIVIISIYSALSIWHWQNVRERDNRKLFAIKQTSHTDITNDYFLRGIDNKIKKDNFIRNYYQNPFIIKSQFEKRIRQLYFTGYLSKFDVQLLDFDTLGNHFKQRNDLSFNQANKLYYKQQTESFAESFKYLQTLGDIKGYIGKFTIKEGRQKLGYLFIILKPKLIQNENRFDDILVEGNTAIRPRISEYSYAVYKDKRLVYQSGDYAYTIINTWGDNETYQYRFFDENSYNHLTFTDSQPLTVVVSKPSNSISQVIGLFSFIFTCCTVILILVLLVFILMNLQILKKWKITNNPIINWFRAALLKLLMMEDNQIILIRTRIQTSIVFIVFTTLLFSSYFTIKFTSDKYNLRQTDRLIKKLRNIVINAENERINTISSPFAEGEVKAFINQIADFYDTDISLYNTHGRLVSSSIGKLYDEHIISPQMHPLAYFHLNQLRESQYSQTEKIGTLTFQAAYAPLFNSRNEVVGYLQLPYFSKQMDLLSEISSVVIGFVNLYVLLFIIIVIIAYWVSRNISYPLTLIQQRLSNTSLGKNNDPILWQRDDEIGELVKQYNSMIMQLDESARKLAETERQGAWREIARQIAHEIKNPLTPMKLSVQHLQRAYANNDSNLGDKVARTANLLITQIDILSELANEFSSYAKMPTPTYENIRVYDTLNSLIELYKQGNEHLITLHCNKNLVISFDMGYLNRTLSNLIKNAIQAIPEGNIGEITVEVIEHNENIKIFVKDNGSGMDKEQADKIFTPYFSTKISGMGLGLPIVKNMIESGGGQISFTTKPSIGTEFCVTLPKQQGA
ncbi:MAG: sensor histidine kinase [Bacteroidetes bacterium]|nr:MAG: sensor histidine kinase [Bacteroidota bacterium]